MNGANAEPLAKTSNAPNIRRKMTIGASHHFLRSQRNCQNSLRIENLLTAQTG